MWVGSDGECVRLVPMGGRTGRMGREGRGRGEP